MFAKNGDTMKKSTKKRSLVPLIVILVIVLIAVVGVIVWKQMEYAASDDFYDGLRGALANGGLRVC